MPLTSEQCKPCEKGGTPLPAEEARELAREVPLWTLAEKQIERGFKFKDFLKAMEFVNRMADAAQADNHHPDIFISYSLVRVTLSTHKVGGLSRNDFILAAKIDRIAEALGK
jgi:4a-hydroxytetrahydrobiopterin dehydratase